MEDACLPFAIQLYASRRHVLVRERRKIEGNDDDCGMFHGMFERRKMKDTTFTICLFIIPDLES
jgi:hypothetical protein